LAIIGFYDGFGHGIWLTLKHGSRFFRRVFLLVVSLLFGKFAWDILALFH